MVPSSIPTARSTIAAQRVAERLRVGAIDAVHQVSAETPVPTAFGGLRFFLKVQPLLL